MEPTATDSVSPEFAIDTSAAAPLDIATAAERLEELLALRGTLTNHAREVFRVQREAEDSIQAQRKQATTMTQAVVAVIDEFERLLADTRRNLAVSPAAADASTSGQPVGFLGRLLTRRRAAPPVTTSAAGGVESAWLEAFGRVTAHWTGKLEDLGVHRVPLLGKDLKTLAFRGTLVKQFVSVKNKPQGGSLVVTEELRGLWLTTNDGQLLPVQGGEVTV